MTVETGKYYEDAEDITDWCAALAILAEGVTEGAATPVAGPVGAVCALDKLLFHNIARKAERCEENNQCLKLVGLLVPQCVGGSECCDQSVGTWVDPTKHRRRTIRGSNALL